MSERATFVSEVSFAPTKPFTDAFPAEAAAQTAAFNTPSYAVVAPRAETGVTAAPVAQGGARPTPDPHYHLPRALDEVIKPSPDQPFPVVEFAIGAAVVLGVFLLAVFVVKPWISGATSTSP